MGFSAALEPAVTQMPKGMDRRTGGVALENSAAGTAPQTKAPEGRVSEIGMDADLSTDCKVPSCCYQPVCEASAKIIVTAGFTAEPQAGRRI